MCFIKWELQMILDLFNFKLLLFRYILFWKSAIKINQTFFWLFMKEWVCLFFLVKPHLIMSLTCWFVCVCFQVVDQSGLRNEAVRVLSSLHLRLNEGSCFEGDRVHLRIKELQNTITQMEVEPSTHTHPSTSENTHTGKTLSYSLSAEGQTATML